MATLKNGRQIQLEQETVNALIKQGLDRGFKGFKAYAEHILREQSLVKELTQLQTKKTNNGK